MRMRTCETRANRRRDSAAIGRDLDPKQSRWGPRSPTRTSSIILTRTRTHMAIKRRITLRHDESRKLHGRKQARASSLAWNATPVSEDLVFDSREHRRGSAGRSSYLLVLAQRTSESTGLHPRHMHAPRKQRYRDLTRLLRNFWNIKGPSLEGNTMTTSEITMVTMAGNGGSGAAWRACLLYTMI